MVFWISYMGEKYIYASVFLKLLQLPEVLCPIYAKESRTVWSVNLPLTLENAILAEAYNLLVTR